MKCPYPDCQKDYNDKVWPPYFQDFVPDLSGMSQAEIESPDKLYIKARRCLFCGRFFYDIHRGYKKNPFSASSEHVTVEFLMSYPSAKTRFEAKGVPRKVRDAYNEAERCRSVGSLTGLGACLRKTIYAVCDDKGVQGEDYRQKITDLPVKDPYKELLKQIKWLGDNTTKPGEDNYTMDMADLALEILPVLVDELYAKDERVETATKLLAKTRAQKSQPKDK